MDWSESTWLLPAAALVAVAALVAAIGLWLKLRSARNELNRFRHQPGQDVLALLEATLESTENGVLITDLDGKVIRANARFTQMWNLPPEMPLRNNSGEMVKTVIDGLTHPQEFVADLKQLYASPDMEVSKPVEFKDGSAFELGSSPIVVDEAVVGRLWVYLDVTDRRQTENELRLAKEAAESANRSKGTFLAVMSHEIRTPLNGILGLTELLMNSDLSTDQRDQLQTVYSSGQILLMILNDVLDFSKMEANQFELSSREFSANDLIDQVLRLYSQNANAKNILLSGGGVPSLHRFLIGDPNRLQQVLTNLVSNAVKFTDSGTVQLHAELLEQSDTNVRLRFVVEDTGIGMSRDEIERLFQPFSQADESNSRNYGGTGLGLVIAQRLVRLMGGDIQVESETGKGSCFQFDLDFVKGAAGKKAFKLPPMPIQVRPRAERILVVEDIEMNQKVALGMLNTLGFQQVDLASNGIDALEFYARHDYAMVLMDIRMPKMDGYTATRLIRTMDEEVGSDRHVPIIAVTAHAFGEDRKNILESGMDGHITKPLTGAKLADSLSLWLPETVSSAKETTALKDVSIVVSTTGLNAQSVRNLHRDLGGSIGLILDAYAGELETQIAIIEEAIKNHDRGRLRSAAHRLKGSSRNIGALTLGDLCDSIEKRADKIESIQEKDLRALLYEKELVREALSAPWIQELR